MDISATEMFTASKLSLEIGNLFRRTEIFHVQGVPKKVNKFDKA